jgi:hypothetical protein
MSRDALYGTLMMIFLMESACGSTVAGHLPPGWVTVGSEVCPPSCVDPGRARRRDECPRRRSRWSQASCSRFEAHDGQRKMAKGCTDGAVKLENFAKRSYGSA